MIIKLTSKLLGKKIKINEKDKNNCSIRNINSKKSQKILRFKPRVTIDEGVRKILKIK